MNHEWQDRLSEFLDGSLSESDATAVTDHLEGCGECRGILEDLRHVVAQAKGLAATGPGKDLWPGIAAAIQAPIEAESPQVIELPSARSWDGNREGRRGLSLSVPQLAAAATVLMLVSATITYAVGPGVAVRDSGAAPAVGAATFVTAPDGAGPPEALSEELAELEALLVEAGSTLDAETVTVLQNNLEVIERAIADSRRALAQDPANGFLMEHLERSYERKLDFLREAARVVSWAS